VTRIYTIGNNYIMHALVILSSNQHMKFEVSSFSDSKSMIVA